MRRAGCSLLLLAALLAPPHADAAVIQRVFGANSSEIGWATPAGGTHVYLSGTGIGSAFSPPTVFVGINADAECMVQPFTSTRNRLHCILDPEGLPPLDVEYKAAGRFVDHPLRVLKSGRLARCWHTGGINHACFLRFDLAGAPRIHTRHASRPRGRGVVSVLGTRTSDGYG